MKKSTPIIVLALFMILTSCDQTLLNLVEEIPDFPDLEYSIPENTEEGSLIDTLVFEIPDSTFVVKYEIAGGNTGNAFFLDELTGILTVNNQEMMDFESYPEFDLTIRAYTDTLAPLSVINNVLIKLENIVPSTDSLVALFNFNGAIEDQITGYSPVLSNGYLLKELYSNNIFLKLSGSDSYVDLIYPFDYESRTISIWFDASAAEPNTSTLMYDSDSEITRYGNTIMSLKDSADNAEVFLNASRNWYWHKIDKKAWHHAVITVDKMQFAYYVDGEMVHSGQITEYIHGTYGHDAALLGCSYKFDRFFKGSMDNVRIYNRALSLEEIKILYTEEY